MKIDETAKVAGTNLVLSGAGVRLKVVKVNADRVPEVADRYRLLSLPTLSLLVGGEEVEQSRMEEGLAEPRLGTERVGRQGLWLLRRRCRGDGRILHGRSTLEGADGASLFRESSRSCD